MYRQHVCILAAPTLVILKSIYHSQMFCEHEQMDKQSK